MEATDSVMDAILSSTCRLESLMELKTFMDSELVKVIVAACALMESKWAVVCSTWEAMLLHISLIARQVLIRA